MAVTARRILVVALVVVAVSVGIAFAFYREPRVMNAADAEARWGVAPLDESVFRSADLSRRAAMAVDIVKRGTFVGSDRVAVREALGDPDSYYWSDTLYAYKLEPYPGVGKESWHLVFVPDERLEKIEAVRILQKCCQ